jgi:2-dehydro-3-deoxyphosphogluconate aldolase/(4S)-4-hydroxy-2-oxoglutarate aldolase
MVATGGVTATNAADFLRAGYDAVAVGSAFASPAAAEALAKAISVEGLARWSSGARRLPYRAVS